MSLRYTPFQNIANIANILQAGWVFCWIQKKAHYNIALSLALFKSPLAPLPACRQAGVKVGYKTYFTPTPIKAEGIFDV